MAAEPEPPRPAPYPPPADPPPANPPETEQPQERQPETTEPGPRKLSLVVYSGSFDKVHYALVLASAAAAVGTPATLFFTMDAARFLQKPLADGTPGWRSLPARPGEPAAGLPAVQDGPTAGAADDDYEKRGVATFEELLSACAAFGVTFMVCEMGLRVIGLDVSALREDLKIAKGGVVSFLADASERGAMMFI
jgi:peroxiredoxin family protein